MRWVKIFDDWKTASETLLQDEPFLLRIGSRKVAIVRRNDQIFAFQPLCPHQNEPLYKGHVNAAGEIICPLHAYRFDLRTGRECLERTPDMATYPVKMENGIFIGID